MSLYETYIISDLIVPAEVTQYNSIHEILLDAKMEIWVKKTRPGLVSKKNHLQWELTKSGLYTGKERILNDSIKEANDSNILSVMTKMSPLSPKRSIALVSTNNELLVNYVKNKILGGKYPCYKIENAALVLNYWDILLFRLVKEVKEIISLIDAGGISRYWRELSDLYSKLIIEHQNVGNVLNESIRLVNLISVLFWGFVALFVAFVVFIGEVFNGGKRSVVVL
jgi:hypothetical protein